MSTVMEPGVPVRRGTLALERIATFVFCLSALSFGWWLGGGFPQAAAEDPLTKEDIFSCAPYCDDAYLDYRD